MQMQNRGTLFGGGIVMVVLGIIFLAFPGFTMSFFTVLAGIGFLAGASAQSSRGGARVNSAEAAVFCSSGY